MTIKQTLTDNHKVRSLFLNWYTANVGDKESLAKWLSLHPRFQIGTMLEFLKTLNIGIDVVDTAYRHGFNIRVLDTAKFPEEEARATTWLYEDIDGDIYIQRTTCDGDAYTAAIVAAVIHCNSHSTIKINQHEP